MYRCAEARRVQRTSGVHRVVRFPPRVADSRPRTRRRRHFIDAAFDEMCSLGERNRRSVPDELANGSPTQFAHRQRRRSWGRGTASSARRAFRPASAYARVRHRNRQCSQPGAHDETLAASPERRRLRRTGAAVRARRLRSHRGDVLVTGDHRGLQHSPL
jgi:hypothetical protein